MYNLNDITFYVHRVIIKTNVLNYAIMDIGYIVISKYFALNELNHVLSDLVSERILSEGNDTPKFRNDIIFSIN